MSEFYREYFTPGVYIDTHGFPYHPEFPRFLEDRPAPVRIPGQLELNVSTTKLPTLTKVVTGFTLVGALWSVDHWLRPTLKTTVRPTRGGVFRWWDWTRVFTERIIDPRVNYVGHDISKGAAHAAHGPSHTLNAMAMRWEQLTWNLTFLTRQLELMFRRLRYHVIPREIRKQTQPLKVQQRRLRRGLATVTADENALNHWVHHELNHNVKPRIGRVEVKVNHTLPQRIRRGEKLQARTRARVKQHTRLINKLLPLLTAAGAAALVLKAFTRLGLNFLRCQNVKGVGEELCAAPPGSGRRLGRFLRGILSGLGGLLAPLFICQIFEAAVLLAAPLMSKMIEVVGIAGSALCDGRHSAAPPLPLLVTADPPVANPLPL